MLSTGVAGSFCLAVLAVLTLAPQPAEAQILYGSIVGNVKDPSDAAIGAAIVVATHKETAQVRQAISSELGAFSFPTLQAGVYEIRVTKDGFRTATTEVTVSIN